MSEPSELRALVRLAGPLAIQQIGFQLMGSVDALMLGRYSDAALAGSGVGNNLIFAITAIGLGIVMGMDAVVPQALGGNRLDDARRAVRAGVRLALIVGLATTVLVFAAPWLLAVVGVEPDVVREARRYVDVRAIGVVVFLLTVVLRSYLAAHGRTRPLLLAVLAGNAVNVVLDLALIYGVPVLGIPALGVVGAAIATLVVQALSLGVYALAVRAVDAGAPRPPPTSADLAQILRYGLPIGGQLLAEIGIFGVATVAAAYLGKRPAAAHSIALNLASFTFSFSLGIASATTVRVGQAVGAGDLALARRRGLLGIRIGLAAMACFAAAFALVPRWIAGAFTSDPAVLTATVPLLQIAALFQLSDGTQTIGAGALRGLGDTRGTLWGNLLGHYVVGLPVIVWLGLVTGGGAPGLWWGLSAGLTVTGGYLVVRFLRGTRTGNGTGTGTG